MALPWPSRIDMTLALGPPNSRGLAALGDLNGDGKFDFSATMATTGSMFQTFSLSPTTYAMETPLAFATSHAMFAGIPNLEVGRATAALGEDHDDNGIEDVIVCGPYDGTHGFVSIYHPDTDLDYDAAVPLETIFDSHADIATGGRFGSSSTAVGDIDGDGVADIAVGIWFFNSGGRALHHHAQPVRRSDA